MAAAAAIEGKLADVRLQSQAVADGCSSLKYRKISLRPDTSDIEEDEEDEGSQSLLQVNNQLVPTNATPSKRFLSFKGLMAPFDSGLGKGLFYNLRYDETGAENPSFVLNNPQYRNASILLVSDPNFGCGSSREHASWALLDYGFRCVLAPGFADMFYNNAFKNGLLPVRIPSSALLKRLEMEACASREITVDLVEQKIFDNDGIELGGFSVESYRRHNLLHDLDDIDSTLQLEGQIAEFERKRNREHPWVEESAKLLRAKKCASNGLQSAKTSFERGAEQVPLSTTSLQW